MIKLNELRTGNLLNYDTSEGETLPTKIDWQDLKWLDEDPKGFNLVHTPIPLTEEKLKELSFENWGEEVCNEYELEQKIKADFIAYFGNEPKEIKIDGEIAYVDGFYCRILNNKSIKKTHGIAWRRDN